MAEGKVAVCTGSGRPGGLGEAILRRLGEDGYRLRRKGTGLLRFLRAPYAPPLNNNRRIISGADDPWGQVTEHRSAAPTNFGFSISD